MRNVEQADKVRRTAEALFDQHQERDDEAVQQRAKERQALAAKVARLRELRLAKEAEDTKSAQQAPLICANPGARVQTLSHRDPKRRALFHRPLRRRRWGLAYDV
jgi:hypothetical protein